MLFRSTKADCEKIEFLDLEIRIEGGKLVTNLFIKPTNEQIYLDYNSNHPEHCKQGIPYSQALRIMERCATTTDRDTHFTNLESKLVQRNYPQELVTQQIARAKTKERKGLIFQQRKNKAKSDDKVRLIFTHGAAGKKLLSRNEQAKSMGDRIQICSKQPKNLLRMKNGPRGGNKPHPYAGCYKCNHCKVSCPILNESKTFKSTNTSKVYKIEAEGNMRQ